MSNDIVIGVDRLGKRYNLGATVDFTRTFRETVMTLPRHFGRLGQRAARRATAGLRRQGIQKCHLFVFSQNASAIAFWAAIGFTGRTELSMMSALIDSS